MSSEFCLDWHVNQPRICIYVSIHLFIQIANDFFFFFWLAYTVRDITLVKGHHELYPLINCNKSNEKCIFLRLVFLRNAFPQLLMKLENSWSSSERNRRVCILDGRKGVCEALLWTNSGYRQRREVSTAASLRARGMWCVCVFTY